MEVLDPALMLTENFLWLPGIEALELVECWFTVNPYDKNWENTMSSPMNCTDLELPALNSYHNLSKIMKNCSPTLMARAQLEFYKLARIWGAWPPGAEPTQAQVSSSPRTGLHSMNKRLSFADPSAPGMAWPFNIMLVENIGAEGPDNSPKWPYCKGANFLYPPPCQHANVLYMF